MSSNAMSTLARAATRQLRTSTPRQLSSLRPTFQTTTYRSISIPSIHAQRLFSTTHRTSKGLLPETDNPAPRVAEAHPPAAPIELSTEAYNELSDVYMDRIVARLEALQEEREDVDVEYSVSSIPS